MTDFEKFGRKVRRMKKWSVLVLACLLFFLCGCEEAQYGPVDQETLRMLREAYPAVGSVGSFIVPDVIDNTKQMDGTRDAFSGIVLHTYIVKVSEVGEWKSLSPEKSEELPQDEEIILTMCRVNVREKYYGDDEIRAGDTISVIFNGLDSVYAETAFDRTEEAVLVLSTSNYTDLHPGENVYLASLVTCYYLTEDGVMLTMGNSIGWEKETYCGWLLEDFASEIQKRS